MKKETASNLGSDRLGIYTDREGESGGNIVMCVAMYHGEGIFHD